MLGGTEGFEGQNVAATEQIKDAHIYGRMEQFLRDVANGDQDLFLAKLSIDPVTKETNETNTTR